MYKFKEIYVFNVEYLEKKTLEKEEKDNAGVELILPELLITTTEATKKVKFGHLASKQNHHGCPSNNNFVKIDYRFQPIFTLN